MKSRVLAAVAASGWTLVITTAIRGEMIARRILRELHG